MQVIILKLTVTEFQMIVDSVSASSHQLDVFTNALPSGPNKDHAMKAQEKYNELCRKLYNIQNE